MRLKLSDNITSKAPLYLFIIAIIGFFLRLINLGAEPFWGDEILSLDITRTYLQDIKGLFEYLKAVEIHPPLYYLLQNIWIKLFGISEFSIRFLSVLFGVGVIVLGYYAGKILFKSERIGLTAAFIIAILPMQIELSQDARPYIIFCFFGLLSLIFLWKYLEEKKKLYVFLFSLTSIVGFYLHYSYLFILVPASIYFIGHSIAYKGKNVFFAWLFSMSFIFLSFYWWLEAFIFKLILNEQVFFNVHRGYYFVRPLDFFGKTADQLIWSSLDPKLLVTKIELFAILIFKILLVVCLVKIIYDWGKENKGLKAIVKPIVFLLSVILGGMSLFMFSENSVSYTNFFEKHVIINGCLIAIIIAWILISLKNKKIYLAVLSVFMISLITFDISVIANDEGRDEYHPLKSVMSYINEYYREGDMLLTFYSFSRSDLNYYLRDDAEFIGIFPYQILNNDLYYSRRTLGFLENESQFRFKAAENESPCVKVNYLLSKNNPKRVWIYAVKESLLDCFSGNEWRKAIWPVDKTFAVTLFVKNNAIQK